MGLAHHTDTLVPPALKILGFQLWDPRTRVPDATDFYDGNWLHVTAHCGANGASIWVSGAILMVTDIKRFANQCQALYESCQGEALLEPCEPNLLISLKSSDRRGHILMRVELTPDHMTQDHRMKFEIDQSYLPALIAQCRGIVEAYAIRGKVDL